MGMLGRRTLAGMLSEALCSRARRVSEEVRGGSGSGSSSSGNGNGGNGNGNGGSGDNGGQHQDAHIADDDLPFARRAKEEGRKFRGGKCDGMCFFVFVF